MELTQVDPVAAPAAIGGYTNALLVEGATRFLFISGQIPQTSDGLVPAGIEAQCRLVWANVKAMLDAAGMDFSNLVKVTTFLSDRGDAAVNTAVRSEMLGGHRPALTVVVTSIFDPAWLLEVEAVAAA